MAAVCGLRVQSVRALGPLSSIAGRWAGVVPSRGFIGKITKDRPKVSQSKVLSGDDGLLFSLESEWACKDCKMVTMLFIAANRIKPEFLADYVKLS